MSDRGTVGGGPGHDGSERSATTAGRRLSVGFVPGVQPDKWLTRWRERRPTIPVSARRVADPLPELTSQAGDDGFDVVFLREPEGAARSAPPGLLRIPLYTETMAVLAEKDHPLAAYGELTPADLDGERWLDPVDPMTASIDEVGAALDLVAAGVGLLVLPQPYAHSLSRRDVVDRPLEGVPATRMGVAWSPAREGDELIDEFVGIVRGRTINTSRGGARADSSSASPPPSRGRRRGGGRRSGRG